MKKKFKILVTDSITSHKDLVARLKKRWPNIRFSLGNQNRRHRKLKYPDLILYILRLDRLPINELYKQAGIEKSKYQHYYKYQLIAKILMLRGKDPAESVRKYLLKYKRLLRNHKDTP